MMRQTVRHKGLILNTLSAASTAVLLSLVHAHPDYWYISLFALIPFLWRLCHVGRAGSISLAIMLATLFTSITAFADSSITPTMFVFRLITFNIAFGAFSLGVNRIKKSFGFDPLAIALMWFPVEYVLVSFANLGSVFSISEPGSKIVVGFCSLFGLLLGSLIVVLINALILWFFRYVGDKICANDIFRKKKFKSHYPQQRGLILKDISHYSFGPRAPPVVRFR